MDILHRMSGGYIIPLAFLSTLLFIALIISTMVKETAK